MEADTVPFLAGRRRPILPYADWVSLTLNGEARSFDGTPSVDDLLRTLGLDPRKVAVERNEAIVPRSMYAETWLPAATRWRSCTSSVEADDGRKYTAAAPTTPGPWRGGASARG